MNESNCLALWHSEWWMYELIKRSSSSSTTPLQNNQDTLWSELRTKKLIKIVSDTSKVAKASVASLSN